MRSYMTNRSAILRSLCLLLLGSSCTFAALQAQDAKYRLEIKSDLIADPDENPAISKIVKGDVGTVVALKTNGQLRALGGILQGKIGWSLATYNRADMKLLKKDAPKIVFGTTPVALETIEHFGGQLRLLATQPDPANGKLLFIQQVISPRSLTGKGAQLLHTLPYDRLGKPTDYFASNTPVGFGTVIGVDSTKMLIHLTPDLTTRSAGCPIFAMAFNKDMQLLWQNSLQLDPKARGIQILATRVDKNGSAWYLLKNIHDPEPQNPGEVGYEIVLYKLDSLGQTFVKVDPPGSDYATDARIELLPDGRVACAGVYSAPDYNRSEAVGLFYSVLDPQTADATRGMQWGSWHLNEFQKVADKKKGAVLQKNVAMVRLITRRDGGVEMIAENNGLETYMSSSLAGKPVEKTSWTHGDIHVMRLNATGTPLFYSVVVRKLYHEVNEPGGVIAISYTDNLLLLFNDDKGDFEKRKEGAPIDRVATTRDAMWLEFKGDGTYKHKVVINDGYDHGLISPPFVWPITPSLTALLASPTFGGSKTFPVCVQFSTLTKR